MNLFSRIKRALIFRKYGNRSFSQEGEDQLLDRMLAGKQAGFYLDIGAHHPIRYSNTYKFYLRGWKGINVDAMPGSMLEFNKMRPLDINIEKPVSRTKQTLNYYIFNDSALNTMSEAEMKAKSSIEGYFVERTVPLETVTLAEILDQYLPADVSQIDFMSIDVEGLDMEVLQSNNWDKYRPEIILVEELWQNMEDILTRSVISEYLHKYGYKLTSRLYNTSFYTLRNRA